MTALSLIIAIIALIVAILAYQRTEGSKDLKTQVNTLRVKTADALGKIEKALRKEDKKDEGSPDEKNPE